MADLQPPPIRKFQTHPTVGKKKMFVRTHTSLLGQRVMKRHRLFLPCRFLWKTCFAWRPGNTSPTVCRSFAELGMQNSCISPSPQGGLKKSNSRDQAYTLFVL